MARRQARRCQIINLASPKYRLPAKIIEINSASHKLIFYRAASMVTLFLTLSSSSLSACHKRPHKARRRASSPIEKRKLIKHAGSAKRPCRHRANRMRGARERVIKLSQPKIAHARAAPGHKRKRREAQCRRASNIAPFGCRPNRPTPARNEINWPYDIAGSQRGN